MDLIKTLNNFFSKPNQITPADLIEFCKQEPVNFNEIEETAEDYALFIGS